MRMVKLLFILAIGSLIGTLAVGCSSERPRPKIIYKSLSEVPADTLKKLQVTRFFFGHQSVGKNILQGVEELAADNRQINLKIVLMENPAEISPGALGHTRVGENTSPEGKIDAFKEWIANGIGQDVDVAFLKLCYLDIEKDTDVEKLFAHYRQTMTALKNEFPKVRFVHFTAPLTVSKTSWKTRVKKLIGKTDLWEYNDNIKRNAYNDLLLETYKDKEPVFDLAAVEATRQDGKPVTFSFKGKTYYSLNPAYTHDGGHLNEVGRRRVADALLALLASLT